MGEDIVGYLINMPVKPQCETAANLGERCILLVFIAIGPRTQCRYAWTHMPWTEPVPAHGRLPRRDLPYWLPPRRPSTSVSIRRTFLCGHICCAIESGPSCGRLSTLFVLALRVLLHTTVHVKDTPLPPFTSESMPPPNGAGTEIPTCSRSFSLHRIHPLGARVQAQDTPHVARSCTVTPARRAQVGLYAGRGTLARANTGLRRKEMRRRETIQARMDDAGAAKCD
jgi:hypothetical protein